jgi:hypothetical protein
MSINWKMDMHMIWYTHILEHYSEIKGMDFENIMLNERNQLQNAKYCIASFIWKFQDMQIWINRKETGGSPRLRDLGARAKE